MQGLLYSQIADDLMSHMRDGRYIQGDRLPSVRSLAKKQSVSIATVNSAYALLEAQGWVEARPKSGYFVRYAIQSSIKPPKVVTLRPKPKPVTTTELAIDVQRGSRKQTGSSFGAATPDLAFPISGVIQRTFARLARSGEGLGGGYDDIEGYQELRHQVARRALDAGISITEDDVITTAGAQNAIALALRALTQPGDIIAVESPCYHGSLQMIEGFGLKAIEIPVDPLQGLSVDALKLALQQWPIKAVLTISNFSNPLGCSIPESNKREIYKLLQQFDVSLIEDDIYGDLQFEGSRPKTFKALDTDGRVIWCSSVSKTMDPQLRVGWMAPGKLFKEVTKQKYISMLVMPTFSQAVTADVMASGQFDRHLRQARLVYKQRSLKLHDLASEYFPEPFRASSPKGGLVTWFELPKQVNTTELYYRCIDADIRIAPGELFSISGLYRHCFRMNFAKPWTAEREQAVKFIGEQIKQLL